MAEASDGRADRAESSPSRCEPSGFDGLQAVCSKARRLFAQTCRNSRGHLVEEEPSLGSGLTTEGQSTPPYALVGMLTEETTS